MTFFRAATQSFTESPSNISCTNFGMPKKSGATRVIVYRKYSPSSKYPHHIGDTIFTAHFCNTPPAAIPQHEFFLWGC